MNDLMQCGPWGPWGPWDWDWGGGDTTTMIPRCLHGGGGGVFTTRREDLMSRFEARANQMQRYCHHPNNQWTIRDNIARWVPIIARKVKVEPPPKTARPVSGVIHEPRNVTLDLQADSYTCKAVLPALTSAVPSL